MPQATCHCISQFHLFNHSGLHISWNTWRALAPEIWSSNRYGIGFFGTTSLCVLLFAVCRLFWTMWRSSNEDPGTLNTLAISNESLCVDRGQENLYWCVSSLNGYFTRTVVKHFLSREDDGWPHAWESTGTKSVATQTSQVSYSKFFFQLPECSVPSCQILAGWSLPISQGWWEDPPRQHTKGII